jgi:bifunctional DNA-binding transcriptional regulator/antitoxin component of YhaV-PrlF toxin-antitoxin module
MRSAALRLDCNAVMPQDEGMSEAAPNYHGFLTMQSRGVIALPPELRRRYQLDRPGAQVEITERPDGVLEIRPTLAIPANQAWFWTDAWQKREREADADIAAGRLTAYDDVDALLDDLPS